MKYLLLLGVLLVVYLLWRHQRAKDSAAPPGDPAVPLEMVRCARCAMHLPRSDALVDARGQFYCCAEHRQRDTE